MTAAHDLTRWIAEIRERLDRIEKTFAPANDASGETFSEWARRWSAERRIAAPADELRVVEIWIEPTLGKLPIASVSRSDLEAWVEMMDRRVAAGELMGSTARRVWSVLSVMMSDAGSSKIRALRVRPDDPTLGVRPPDKSTARASTFLYPSEFLQLAECPEVPIFYRRLYAVTIYLYPRAGELRALRWSDLDLTTGRAHIHSTIDRHGVEGRTKTDADRQFVAERNILPLLRVMREQAPRATRVFDILPQKYNLARALREHLEAADVDRDDLFARGEARRPLTFHDLRATGITWQAMRGDSPTEIMERVGHASLSTTQRYIRRGRLLAVARGERVFPRIPAALLRKK